MPKDDKKRKPEDVPLGSGLLARAKKLLEEMEKKRRKRIEQEEGRRP